MTNTNSRIKEVKSMMDNERLIAVLQEVDCEIEQINIIDETTVEIDGEEYKVLSEAQADEEFKQYQENLIDDLGLESFSKHFQEWILNNCIDTDWFDEAMEESYEYYIEDIKDEGERLAQELEECGCEDEEEYVDYLCGQWSDGVQWYKDNYGIEELSRVIYEENLINWNEVIEEVQNIDGRGCMASYDGEEREQDVNGTTYYIYRTN